MRTLSRTRATPSAEGTDAAVPAVPGLAQQRSGILVSLAPVAVAVALQLLLWPLIDPYAWFLFFPAVFLSGWLGGRRAGLWATAVAAAAVWWVFVPPRYSLDKPSGPYFAAFAFLVVGAALSTLPDRLRRTNDELRAANDRITTLYRHARELDELKSRFFANVSHELRTPLTLILGPTAKLLAQSDEGGELRRQLELVDRNARQLLRQVEDLLDASRLEAGEVRLQYARVDLAGMVRHISRYYEGAAAARSITLDVRAQAPVTAEVDPQQLAVALTNLLANAMKFTPDGGRIRMSAGADEAPGWASIEVADSGPGIEPGQRAVIFERFRQADEGARRRVGGTGLGLSIARDLVALHGGVLDVSQAPEGGALFSLRLPLRAPASASVLPAWDPERDEVAARHATAGADDDAEPEPGPGEAAAPDDGPGASVLVVEDNRDMSRFICEALGTEHRVEAVFDGETALERMRAAPPDLVLSDVMMPGRSGLELLTAMHADPQLSAVPVVVLTARSEDGLRVQMLREGAADYLTKPFSVDELRARVSNLVAASRATAAVRESELLAVRLAAATQQSRRRLEGLLESAPDGMIVVDEEARIRLINRQTEALFGYDREALLGRPVELLIPELARLAHPGWRAGFLATPVARAMGASLDLSARRKDGTVLPVDVSLSPFVTDEGSFVTASVRDITDRRALEDRLRVHGARFRASFEDAPIGMAITELRPPRAGVWSAVNEALCRTLGYPRAELMALGPDALLHPEAAEDRALDPVFSGRQRHAVTERRFRHADGHDVWLRVSMSAVAGPDGTPEFAVTHLEDITARRREGEQLAHAALHDSLTGLPNRTLLMDRLTQRLAELERGAGLLAVLYVDLDRFKQVNDTYGHAVGDGLLIEVAHRLERLVRPSDTAARIAGDEFVVVCRDFHDEREVHQLADRLIAALARPVELDGQTLEPSASVGVAVTRDPKQRAGELLHAADVALYKAKSRGRGRVELYDQALARLSSEREQTEADLHAALAHDRFVLHYQPIVDLSDGSIIGIEALLRLAHPTRGLLLPGEFLDIAETCGLILPIGAWVLQQACAQLADWERSLPRAPTMSVNVSARQVAHGDLRQTTLAALRDSGAASRHLCLEITESVFAEATYAVVDDLSALKAEGVRLAIDDFGTGYSSLAYLKRFPVDVIKIDSGFTAGLRLRQDDTAIIDAITSLGHSLDLTVIAEGVETATQLEALHDLGCTLAQGHRFAPAADAETVTRWLRTGTIAGLPGAARLSPPA